VEVKLRREREVAEVVEEGGLLVVELQKVVRE
jgi:hypothetical protein